MKVVAFNGSPRKEGNTFLMINKVFESLEKEGIETELVQVGGFDGPHGGLKRLADVLGGLADLAPVRVRRDLEAVVLRVGGEVLVATGLIESGLGFFIKDIAEAFEEQEREDERLVVAGINGAAQESGGAPEVGFELLLGDALAHGLAFCFFTR